MDSTRATKEKTPKGVQAKKLLAAVEYLDHGRAQGDDTVFSYRNDETHVEARFVAYRPEHADEVGLAFEMDLPRPTFCAFEMLPAALCVAREKRLSVEVLTDQGSVFYAEPSFEELLDEWRRANARAIAAKKKGLCQGTAYELEAMWEFALVRQDLARRYGRQRVEVPELYPVWHKKLHKVGRMVDWEGLGAVALGESDWVRLVDPPAPLQDGAIYEAEALTLACKPLVRTVPQPIFHYLCDKPRAAQELAARIEPLPKLTMKSFSRCRLDELYDEQGVP